MNVKKKMIDDTFSTRMSALPEKEKNPSGTTCLENLEHFKLMLAPVDDLRARFVFWNIC